MFCCDSMSLAIAAIVHDSIICIVVSVSARLATSVAAHTQGTYHETCAADPLCTGAVCSSESCSANSSV